MPIGGGRQEPELDAIGAGLPENIIVQGKVVGTHILTRHGEIQGAAHATKLEIFGEIAVCHEAIVARGRQQN